MKNKWSLGVIVLIAFLIFCIIQSGYFESKEYGDQISDLANFNPGGKEDLDAFVNKFLE